MKRPWLILILGFAAPGFAATLKGLVTADEAPISDARVLVFHGITGSLFVHRGKSDRNGRYFFKLDPGPYRVIVMKKGYQPIKANAMIYHNKGMVALEHQLQSTVNGVEPSFVVRKTLRKNKDPHKRIGQDALIDATLAPAPDQSFAGSVETRSLRGLDGDVGLSSAVQVRAQVGDSVRVDSSVVNERRDSMASDAYQIKASVAVELGEGEFGIDAETIHMPDADLGVGSRAVGLSGEYGRDVRLTSSLSMRQSQGEVEDQQELSLDQQIAYSLSSHPVAHKVAYTDWQRDHDLLARYAAVSTEWRHGKLDWLGLQSDLEYFTLRDASRTAAKVWLAAERRSADDRLLVNSKVGVREEEGEAGLVQNHQIGASWGSLNLFGEYVEDYAYQSFASADVFGEYLPQPLTPYANESFYSTKTRQAALRLGLDHGSGWASGFSLKHADDQASRLYAHDATAYRNQTGRQSTEYGYSLSTDRYGSRIEINHASNENDAVSFDQTGLTYTQAFNPFRQRSLGFLLELQMKNTPGVPAWWLLQELPWDQNETGAWFEGHLSVQF